jgi:uncharacterized membrane protein
MPSCQNFEKESLMAMLFMVNEFFKMLMIMGIATTLGMCFSLYHEKGL